MKGSERKQHLAEEESELWWGFPGGSFDKETTCNSRDPGLIPESGRSPWEGNGNLLQYSCLGNPVDRGAWWVTVHGVTKESNMTKWLSRGYLPWFPVTALHSWNRAWSCWQLKAICWWPSPHLVSKAIWVLHWCVYHSLLPILYFSILKKGLTNTMQSNIYSKHISHSQEATWYHT